MKLTMIQIMHGEVNDAKRVWFQLGKHRFADGRHGNFFIHDGLEAVGPGLNEKQRVQAFGH